MAEGASADRDVGRGPGGEEHLRFIRNFHDVFLSIGIAMFGAGLAIVTVLLLRDIVAATDSTNWRRVAWIVMAAGLVCAGVMWALGEVFARSRRLFLPAIAILLFFTFFMWWPIIAAYGLIFIGAAPPENVRTTLDAQREFPVFFSALTALVTLFYYARMRLPFAMGQFGFWVAMTFMFGAILLWPALETGARGYWVQLAAGLALFAAALGFDARDPQRLTRLSDNAFWLHFSAAPLIFNATVSLVTAAFGEMAGGTAWALAVLVVVLVFAFVSVLINRRALIVAGLLTAILTTGVLLSRTGLDGMWTAALTLLLLGGLMVLLGGGWKTARRIATRAFPRTGPISRIIPPEARVL